MYKVHKLALSSTNLCNASELLLAKSYHWGAFLTTTIEAPCFSVGVISRNAAVPVVM